MEKINFLVTGENGMAWLIAAGSMLLVVLMLGLWIQSRKKAVGTARDLDGLRDELSRTKGEWERELAAAKKQTAQLQQRLQGGADHTYLPDFKTEAIYAVIAKFKVDLNGTGHVIGLVKTETGQVVPFLTPRDMGYLEEGDYFTLVRGQLMKSQGPPVALSPPQQEVKKGLRNRAVAPDSGADRDEDATLMLSGSDADATLMAPQGGASPVGSGKYAPYLRVTKGADEGKQFSLPFGRASIGRDPANPIPLNDDRASRANADILYSTHRFHLQDRKSTNGTWHQGKRISRAPLDFGDTIQVGDTEMVFSCKGYDLKSREASAAIAAFEKLLEVEPEFVTALRNLAFLLERDVARHKEAKPFWDRIMALEKAIEAETKDGSG